MLGSRTQRLCSRAFSTSRVATAPEFIHGVPMHPEEGPDYRAHNFSAGPSCIPTEVRHWIRLLLAVSGHSCDPISECGPLRVIAGGEGSPGRIHQLERHRDGHARDVAPRRRRPRPGGASWLSGTSVYKMKIVVLVGRHWKTGGRRALLTRVCTCGDLRRRSMAPLRASGSSLT